MLELPAGTLAAGLLGTSTGARDHGAPGRRRVCARRRTHPVPPDFAVDGIDELLLGFHARDKSKVRTEEPRVLRVRATDRPDAVWTVHLSSGAPLGERGGHAGPGTDENADVDCELAGPVAGLYLALWNRAPFPGVTGDASLATLWREKSAITWN